MKSYWASEDMSVQVETLESFLQSSIELGDCQHTLFVETDEAGNVEAHIRRKASGERIDYKVTDNTVYPAHPAFRARNASPIIAFTRAHTGRLFTLDTFSGYLTLLEELRTAVESHDDSELTKILQGLREWDDEYMGSDDAGSVEEPF